MSGNHMACAKCMSNLEPSKKQMAGCITIRYNNVATSKLIIWEHDRTRSFLATFERNFLSQYDCRYMVFLESEIIFLVKNKMTKYLFSDKPNPPPLTCN